MSSHRLITMFFDRGTRKSAKDGEALVSGPPVLMESLPGARNGRVEVH